MVKRSWLVFAALALASCGGESPTTPTTDWIELNSLTPPNGTVLTAGERVTFTATVTCTIVSSDGGHVAMVVSDQGFRNLIEPGQTPQATLPKGTSAPVTLGVAVTMPESGSSIKLSLPLFVNGSNTTRAIKMADYTVR